MFWRIVTEVKRMHLRFVVYPKIVQMPHPKKWFSYCPVLGGRHDVNASSVCRLKHEMSSTIIFSTEACKYPLIKSIAFKFVE